jgi:hypothetical protein
MTYYEVSLVVEVLLALLHLAHTKPTLVVDLEVLEEVLPLEVVGINQHKILTIKYL